MRAPQCELSSLDVSGNAFLKALKTIFDSAMSDVEFTEEVFYLDGLRIELWLLKILCGILASQNKPVPQKWIEILFGKEAMPADRGLHVFGQPGSATWFFTLVRVLSVKDKEGNIAGAKFGIGGLAFLLAFGKPIFSELGMESFYRPGKINVQKDGKTKQIEFYWGRDTGEASIVHLAIQGVIDDGDSIPRPVVRPYRH